MIDYSKLVGKVLADKDSKKIRLIIDIIQPVEEIKKVNGEDSFLIVRMKKQIKGEIILKINVKLVTKYENIYTWLSITKKKIMKNLNDFVIKQKKIDLVTKLDLTLLKNYRGGGHPR